MITDKQLRDRLLDVYDEDPPTLGAWERQFIENTVFGGLGPLAGYKRMIAKRILLTHGNRQGLTAEWGEQ